MLSPLDSNATIGAAERSIVGDTTAAVPLSNTVKRKVRVMLDLSALLAGDDFSLTFYSKVDGGTQLPLVVFPLVGTYSTLWMSAEVWVYDAYDITLKKNSATDRAIRWAVMADGGYEGTLDVNDLVRLIARQLLGKRTYSDTVAAVRDLDDSKDSHTITVDDIDDPATWALAVLDAAD